MHASLFLPFTLSFQSRGAVCQKGLLALRSSQSPLDFHPYIRHEFANDAVESHTGNISDYLPDCVKISRESSQNRSYTKRLHHSALENRANRLA